MLEVRDIYSCAVALTLTLLGQWLLTPHARRLGLLDHPVGRKDHSCPTPATGGIAMLAGVLLAGIFFAGDNGVASLGFALAATIVILVGVLDDKHDLSWKARIGGQAIAALVLVYLGGIRVEQLGDIVGLAPGSLGWLSVPFTLFIIIGVINAINMIDGADGLAGLLVLSALVMFEAAALYSGNTVESHRLPVFIGAVVGFLIYNLRFPWQRRAKVFMGNAGSAFLGLALACFAVRLTQNPAHPVSPVLGPWLILVPIIDCLVLMIRRLRSKRSPFSADRDHIHHLMIESGFGPTQAAVDLTLFSCACGLAAAELLRLHVPHVLLVVAFVGLCVLWYWMSSRRIRAISFFTWLRRPILSRADDLLSESKHRVNTELS